MLWNLISEDRQEVVATTIKEILYQGYWKQPLLSGSPFLLLIQSLQPSVSTLHHVITGLD